MRQREKEREGGQGREREREQAETERREFLTNTYTLWGEDCNTMVVADLASRCCLQERERHQAFAKVDTEGEIHRILIYAAPEINLGGGVDFRIVGSTELKGNLAERCWLWSTAACVVSMATVVVHRIFHPQKTFKILPFTPWVT